MDHIQIIIRLILVLVVGSHAVRSPPAIPNPDELEYLTSEEEERLIFGGDESIINEKVKHLPSMDIDPPLVTRRNQKPVPTMDPPLPKHVTRPQPPPKSSRGFPFRIPRIFLNNRNRLITPLNRKPRWRSDQTPIPSYRARPSTLVSSEPDQLEVAFKRIEIMASRAGLNMSSMPRRTQMQVLKKLMPKLPPRMSYMVKSAMEGDSEKMYHYLPEPAKDPLEGTPYFAGLQDHDEYHDEFQDTISRPTARDPSFDAGKISIANHDANLEEFAHLPTITENYRTGSISHDLVPPSEFGKSSFTDDSFGAGSHHWDREPHFARDAKSGENMDGKIVASPLISKNQDKDTDSSASENIPMIISPGSLYRSNKLTTMKYYTKNSTPTPIRVSLPTKDRFLTQKPTPRPIRVSIISKDAVTPNKAEPVVKVVHVEPDAAEEEKQEEIPAVVEEVKPDPPPKSHSSDEIDKLLGRVKGISVDIIKEEEAKHSKLIEAKRKATATTTTSTTTTTTAAPDLDKLDMIDDWTEDVEQEQWSDPYDLTDEEIAATVAELKKYEEQGIFENSLEQDFPWRLAPHPLEYPDHPDHPKDSLEELKSEKTTTSSTASPNPVMKRPIPFNGHFRRPGPHGGPRRPPMRRPPMKRPMPMNRRPNPRPHGGGPPPPRPLRINDVTVSEIPKEYNKECDYFSEELCLLVQDYPIEAISEAIDQHPDFRSLLVKEPDAERSWVDGVQRNQEYNYNFKHYFGQRRSDEETTHRHRDFAGEGGFLCPSKVAYGKIKKAKSSTTGEWKYVVNYADKTQTLRLEKCLSPGNTCSYVMPHYRTACTQVYNFHRLLAWDSEKGLHIDAFKVPTCCTCHVQGYYIPQNQHGFTPARARDLPPKLKFTPPRTPMGRGLKRVPTMLNDLMHTHSSTSSKATTQATTAKTSTAKSSATKELKNDLQDLLAQYSALREKIAKTKKDNVQVSYSVSMSNSTDALRRESRTSQFPFNLTDADTKSLLKLKRLHKLRMSLKKMNGTGKLKLKRPLARALLLARRTLKTRLNGGRSMRNMSKVPVDVKERIQTLRKRLNLYMQSKTKGSGEGQTPKTLPDKTRGGENSSSPKTKNSASNNSSKRPNQRLRLSSNRPSKVNYSYHPIMDYFNSKSRTR